MRVIKFSDQDGQWDETSLQEFFTQTLPSRPQGEVYFNQNGVAPGNGLYPGETLLFTFEGTLRYTAKANCYGKMTDRKGNYFRIKPGTLRETGRIPFKELGSRLRNEAGFTGNLRSQPWNKIPDSPEAEEIIESYVDAPWVVSTKYQTKFKLKGTKKKNSYRNSNLHS